MEEAYSSQEKMALMREVMYSLRRAEEEQDNLRAYYAREALAALTNEDND